MLIARKGDTTTLGAKGPVKLKNPWARKGPSILRTFPSEPSRRRRPKGRPKTIDIFPWQPYNKNTNTVYMTGQREVPRAWCNIINP